MPDCFSYPIVLYSRSSCSHSLMLTKWGCDSICVGCKTGMIVEMDICVFTDAMEWKTIYLPQLLSKDDTAHRYGQTHSCLLRERLPWKMKSLLEFVQTFLHSSSAVPAHNVSSVILCCRLDFVVMHYTYSAHVFYGSIAVIVLFFT